MRQEDVPPQDQGLGVPSVRIVLSKPVARNPKDLCMRDAHAADVRAISFKGYIPIIHKFEGGIGKSLNTFCYALIN